MGTLCAEYSKRLVGSSVIRFEHQTQESVRIQDVADKSATKDAVEFYNERGKNQSQG